jgi:hypothetical protein
VLLVLDAKTPPGRLRRAQDANRHKQEAEIETETEPALTNAGDWEWNPC